MEIIDKIDDVLDEAIKITIGGKTFTLGKSKPSTSLGNMIANFRKAEKDGNIKLAKDLHKQIQKRLDDLEL